MRATECACHQPNSGKQKKKKQSQLKTAVHHLVVLVSELLQLLGALWWNPHSGSCTTPSQSAPLKVLVFS